MSDPGEGEGKLERTELELEGWELEWGFSEGSKLDLSNWAE